MKDKKRDFHRQDHTEFRTQYMSFYEINRQLAKGKLTVHQDRIKMFSKKELNEAIERLTNNMPIRHMCASESRNGKLNIFPNIDYFAVDLFMKGEISLMDGSKVDDVPHAAALLEDISFVIYHQVKPFNVDEFYMKF